MYNWSINEDLLKKHPEKHIRWRLEQLINFGLNGEKISQKELKKHWNHLHLDPARRKFLILLLDDRAAYH